jgi:hypothetical protein
VNKEEFCKAIRETQGDLLELLNTLGEFKHEPEVSELMYEVSFAAMESLDIQAVGILFKSHPELKQKYPDPIFL